MQKYSKIVKIEVPIYNSSIIIEYNHTTDQLCNIIKTRKEIVHEINKQVFIDHLKKDDKPYKGFYTNNDYDHIIRITEENDPKELVNTVSHELLHYTLNMLRFRGINPGDEPAEEAFTYLYGYLMGEAYEKLIQHIIKNYEKQ